MQHHSRLILQQVTGSRPLKSGAPLAKQGYGAPLVRSGNGKC
ncbi:hypothetical protein ACET6Z_09195 [Aeromonas veronii]|nr:hypothetical protein [Aeromonas veronii]